MSYAEFKTNFNNMNVDTELSITFKNKPYTYMIIKYNDYITFQRCGSQKEQSGEIKFSSLDELYNTKTIDDILLKDEWSNIEDIIFNDLYSLINDN